MSRLATSSRRAARVTQKTKLLVYRGSDKVDQSAAETIVWNAESASEAATKHQHVGAKGVETGELLVSCMRSTSFTMAATPYACAFVVDGRPINDPPAWEPSKPSGEKGKGRYGHPT